MVPGTGRDGLITDRRDLLKAGLAGTSLGALGVVALGAEEAEAGRSRRPRPVEFDVACLGFTFRWTPSEGSNAAGGDLYGTGIMVEGNMYPRGTIPAGAGFNPDSARPTGHWFCYSTFILGPRRGEPHLLGHQQYVFGRIGPSALFPRNQIVSHGMEGSNPGSSPVFRRAVTGGMGRYRAARGELTQSVIGSNTTRIEQLNTEAPNFRFRITLV